MPLLLHDDLRVNDLRVEVSIALSQDCMHTFVKGDTDGFDRRHVFSDLRPYICLESSCETPHQEYSRRNQWYSHLVQSHWRVWPCPFHCDEEMLSADALSAHLLQTHSQSLRAEEIEYAVEKDTTKPKNISEVACPLCQEVLMSTRMYVKHVGKHQEDLALFALPKLEIPEDDCSVIAEGIEETIVSSNQHPLDPQSIITLTLNSRKC